MFKDKSMLIVLSISAYLPHMAKKHLLSTYSRLSSTNISDLSAKKALFIAFIRSWFYLVGDGWNFSA